MGASLDVLIALLDVSIVFGILYLGLPRARYRRTMLERLATAVGTHNLARDESYRRLIETDSRFSANHHAVAMWAVELLQSECARRVADDSWVRSFADHRLAPGLPLSYRWFRLDGDRAVVFIFSCVLPVLAIWVLAIEQIFGMPAALANETHARLVFCISIFSQGLVSVHVFLGSVVLKRRIDSVEKKIGEMSERLERDEIYSQVKSAGK